MFGSLIPQRGRTVTPSTWRLPTLARFEEEMQGLMDRFWGDGDRLTGTLSFVPKVDLSETDDRFEVTVELPGLKPEEVNLEVKNGALWISGKREEHKEEEGKTWHRIERHHGEFRRVLTLPAAINEEQVDARFENGVLRISLPKSEQSKSKHIEVKT